MRHQLRTGRCCLSIGSAVQRGKREEKKRQRRFEGDLNGIWAAATELSLKTCAMLTCIDNCDMSTGLTRCRSSKRCSRTFACSSTAITNASCTELASSEAIHEPPKTREREKRVTYNTFIKITLITHVCRIIVSMCVSVVRQPHTAVITLARATVTQTSFVHQNINKQINSDVDHHGCVVTIGHTINFRISNRRRRRCRRFGSRNPIQKHNTCTYMQYISYI